MSRRGNAIRAALDLLLLAAIGMPTAAQTLTWIRQTGASGPENFVCAAPDGAGGVYAGGSVHSGGLLARYDHAGNALWILQPGTNQTDGISATAEDGAGGVIAAGSTSGDFGGANAGGRDAYVMRYDDAGNQVWVEQFGSSSDDSVVAAASDDAGGVYVLGETDGSLGGPNVGLKDAWIARHGSSGQQLWIRQLGSTAHDTPWGAAQDGAGGVFICGTTLGDLGGPLQGDYDAWVARYDDTGNLLWIRQIGGSDGEAAYAVAADGAGGVYVAGETDGSLGGPSMGGFYDAWLARYDSAGNEAWIRQPGTSLWDWFESLAPDDDGGVYVGGGINDSGDLSSYDLRVARFDGEGEQLWLHQFGSDAYDFLRGAAPDGAGGLFVTGTTTGDLGGSHSGNTDAWVALFELSSATCFTLDFETQDDFITPLVNGQHIDNEFGALVSISGMGGNAGAAIFDSTPGGPNDPALNDDMLIGHGNVLLLEDDWYSFAETVPGYFDVVTDDPHGGDLIFDFLQPVNPRSVLLADINPPPNLGASVTLVDGNGQTRVYAVEPGWTGEYGNAGPWQLDLTTTAPQPGNGTPRFTTATEDAGFQQGTVVRMVVHMTGFGAIDDLTFCLAEASATTRNGSGRNPTILRSAARPVLGSTWSAELDCSGFGSGLALLEMRGLATSGTFTPFGEVLVNGALLSRTSRAYSIVPSTFTWPIPYDLSMYGFEVHVQGLCRGQALAGRKARAARIVLSNALDLVLGF